MIAKYDSLEVEWRAVSDTSVQSVNGLNGPNIELDVEDLANVGERPSVGMQTEWQDVSDAAPGAGKSSPYTPYPTSFFTSTTDTLGVSYQDALYATDATTVFTISINGTAVYTGTVSTGNKNNNRMDLGWSSYAADFGDVVEAGDLVGIYWSDFESGEPAQEGDVLSYLGGKWRPAPAADGGASSITDLSDWDQTDVKLDQAATWDGSKWVPGYPLLSTGSLASGGTQDSTARVPADMIGPASNYADGAAMEADGWTLEGAVGDDATAGITVPEDLRGTTFFGVDLNPTQVFNGTNGNICWDNTNNTGVSQGRGGDFVTESGGRDFYMAHFSQDTSVLQVGHKWDGTYWTVRVDYQIPYNEANSLGCPVETTFGTDGSVKVVFGTNASSTSITGTGGIAVSGSAAVTGWGSAFSALGDFAWVSIPGIAEGRRLSDLLDVSTTAPVTGDVLTMQATGEYVPTPVTIVGAKDYADRLGAGIVEFTEQSATPDQDGLYNIIDNGDGTGSLIFKTTSDQAAELGRLDEDEEFRIAFDNFEIGYYKRGEVILNNPDVADTTVIKFSPAPTAAKLASQTGAVELYIFSSSFSDAETSNYKFDQGPLVWDDDREVWTPSPPVIDLGKLQSILEDCDDFATFKARMLDY